MWHVDKLLDEGSSNIRIVSETSKNGIGSYGDDEYDGDIKQVGHIGDPNFPVNNESIALTGS